jgi:hypothetical protein
MTLADCRFDWTFHAYDKVFDKQATFSDIDSVLLWKDYFLFIEMKSSKREDEAPFLYPGQAKVYEALGKQDKNTCWLVSGDMQKSIPFFVVDLQTGYTVDLRNCSEMDARAYLRGWIEDWKNSVDQVTERN